MSAVMSPTLGLRFLEFLSLLSFLIGLFLSNDVVEANISLCFPRKKAVGCAKLNNQHERMIHAKRIRNGVSQVDDFRGSVFGGRVIFSRISLSQ